MEIFLSDKIIRKTKIFPIFWEIFPIFAILTLLPVQKNGDFTRFPGKFPVFCVITLPPRDFWELDQLLPVSRLLWTIFLNIHLVYSFCDIFLF